MIYILNISHRPWPKGGGHHIYVGRKSRSWKASPLGNPIRFNSHCQMCGSYHGDNDVARADINKCYMDWLGLQWQVGGEAKKELKRIKRLADDGKDITLMCWCAPKICHAQVLAEVLNSEWKGR